MLHRAAAFICEPGFLSSYGGFSFLASAGEEHWGENEPQASGSASKRRSSLALRPALRDARAGRALAMALTTNALREGDVSRQGRRGRSQGEAVVKSRR